MPLRDLCASLGLAMREGRRASLVCPSCRATRRGGSDRRLPATVNGSGRWTCWACGAWGDSIDLVSYALTGDRYRGQAEVRSWPGWGSIAPSAAPLPEAAVAPSVPLRRQIESFLTLAACTQLRLPQMSIDEHDWRALRMPAAMLAHNARLADALARLPPVRRTRRALARATIMLWLYSLEPTLCVGATTKGGCNRSSGGFVELETMQDFLLEK